MVRRLKLKDRPKSDTKKKWNTPMYLVICHPMHIVCHHWWFFAKHFYHDPMLTFLRLECLEGWRQRGPCLCHLRNCCNEWLAHKNGSDAIGVNKVALDTMIEGQFVCPDGHWFVNCPYTQHTCKARAVQVAPCIAGAFSNGFESPVRYLAYARKSILEDSSALLPACKDASVAVIVLPSLTRRAERGREGLWQHAGILAEVLVIR